MTTDVETVVVGAGIAGAATAYMLARAGRSVTVVEQFEPGHDRGSSHGRSRIHRIGYPDVDWARLAAEADAAWVELERDAGVTLIDRIGVLDAGDVALDVGAALAACGVAHEVLAGSEASRRWPVHFEDDEVVTYQPGGGICRADAALTTFLDGAGDAGADVAFGTQVTAIEPAADAVTVVTPGGALTARAVVVTAGGWGRDLLGPLGIDLPVRVTRETVAYYALPLGDRLPSLIDYAWTGQGDETLPEAGMAGFALAAPGVGLKAGLHKAGHETHADDRDLPSDAIVAWTDRWVEHRYGDAAGTGSRPETCLYTRTDDDRFVLERHDRIVVGSACSGHGFKFGPVVGSRLAALANAALDAD